MEKKVEEYDVVIIGGGAAGLTAGIYSGRARLKTLIIEKALVGGLATYTNEIENFPGFPEGSTGLGLMELFQKQAKKFGVKFKLTDVKKIDLKGEVKIVETFRNRYEAKVVIIASGGRPRVTNAQDEENYLFDKGISFCATCDAAANTDKTVMVIGSGDAAIEEGMFLTKFAKKVIVSVMHDTGKMDCNEIAKEQALNNPKMEFIWNTVVERFEGEERLERVVLKDLKANKEVPVEVDTCFEFIGYLPNTEIFEGQINLSEKGYVIVNEEMETNIEGVFSAGDVNDKTLKQVATAVGDGAIAGYGAEKYIAESEVFYKQILGNEKPMAAFIFDASCSKCRDKIPVMETIEEDSDGQFKVLKVDVYKSKGIADRLKIETFPTVAIIKNGEVQKRIKDDEITVTSVRSALA
jgi:thioredoxin reductase (NADPH)